MERDIFRNVEKAVHDIKGILGDEHSFTLLEDSDHNYLDKFTVAEFVATSAIKAFESALHSLGLKNIEKNNNFDDECFLKCEIYENCEFLRKSDRKLNTTQFSPGIFRSASKNEISEGLNEFLWRFDIGFHVELLIAEEKIDILPQVVFSTELRSSTDTNPRRDIGNPLKTFICEVGTFFKYSSLLSNPTVFKISHSDNDCRTPRRNAEIESLYICFYALDDWCKRIGHYVRTKFNNFDFESEFNILGAVDELEFISTIAPIFPLINDEKLKVAYINNIQANFDKVIVKIINPNMAKITSFCIFLKLTECIAGNFFDGIDYIEDLITKQIVNSIGKSISSRDLEEYMINRSKAIFKPEYCSKPCSFFVTDGGIAPQGLVFIGENIEGRDGILHTYSRKIINPPIVRTVINQQIELKMAGSHFIHGAICQKYSTESFPFYSLNAKAKKFASFAILIGTITGNCEFNTNAAYIIRNNEDLMLPLLFETISNSRKKKDMISSLSPEQRNFVQSIKDLNSESSMFAFSIVQIQPQLESLLNLPPGSLMNEVKLTQEILKLLMDHQVPSNSIGYNGDETSASARISSVRQNVANLFQLISEDTSTYFDDSEANSPFNETAMEEDPEKEMSKGTRKKSKSVGATFISKLPNASVTKRPNKINTSPPPLRRVKSPGTAEKTLTKPKIQSSYSELYSGFTKTTMVPLTIPKAYDTNFDYATYPQMLERALSKLESVTLRPTIIRMGIEGMKTSQSRVSEIVRSVTMDENRKKGETDKTMMLLEALSRSGDITINNVELHMFIVSTHCFNDTVMSKVVRESFNPIDALEKSSLIMAETIYGLETSSMVKNPK